MDSYTGIKKGKSVQHCLDIPPELVNSDLEITIRPIRPKGDFAKQIERVHHANTGVEPFKTIRDPMTWQKESRSDW